MAVQYKCPECEKVLRVASPVAAGKKIKCPACADVFVPEPSGGGSTSKAGEVTAVTSRPRPQARDEEDSDDAPRRSRGKPDAISERGRTSRAIDDEEDDSPRRQRRDRPDEEDEDGSRRRPKKKKKKAKGSNAPLIIGLASAGALLVVFIITAFVWPAFLLSGNTAVAKKGNPGPGPMPMPGPGPGPMPGGGGWEALDRMDLGFKVMMPGKAMSKTQFIGGMKQDIYVVEQGSGAYLVFHQDNVRVEAGKERTVLSAASNGLGTKGRITGQDFKTIQGYPAVEVEAELRNPVGGRIKDLIIVANGRMYQVMVAGTADFVRSADAQKFFSSFQITK